ncbi:four helix bundle protein [Pelobium manganitolerans]|uniref:Four helix bundle protein n=1 Tax=Pelobium manganitolerans TaxID=1842495 RepID=A0A419S5Z1_9SPHI|nr:four helix bundle protein [Pelobium manganitolerans]RKD16254.1 four helix bundle protein [Pelobium manganitolerans]
MAFKFESLKIWHDAMDINDKVLLLTKDYFPKDEQFILTPQIRRAADSIVLNIAEGSTGQTNAVFKTFLGYALRSGIEVISCIFLARKRNYISEDLFREIYTDVEILSKKITALRNKL